jgi:tetratricopeptide (TPR) repeat protein
MASAVICPACHVRNRPKWDFCIGCGHPLEGVASTEIRAQGRGAQERDLGTLYLALMVAVVSGTLALACRDVASRPAPPAATPGIFTFGGPPSPGPSPSPVTQPGRGDADAGRRLLAQGKAAEAIPLLEKAVGEDPGSAEYQQLLGRAQWESGNRDGALGSYAEAARLEPAAYGVSYAQALEAAGRLDDAATGFEAVLAAQPASAVAQEGLGRLYYRRGEYAKALPLLEGLAARTRDLVVLQQLAYAAEKAGDRERAIATYRDVLAAEPRAAAARGLLAESLMTAGRKDDAIAVLQEGLQRTPEAPLLQRGLGSALEQSGRAAEAAAAYREYARLAPNAPDAAQIAARAARLEASPKGSGS